MSRSARGRARQEAPGAICWPNTTPPPGCGLRASDGGRRHPYSTAAPIESQAWRAGVVNRLSLAGAVSNDGTFIASLRSAGRGSAGTAASVLLVGRRVARTGGATSGQSITEGVAD
jgi:hypothetical protein